MVHSPRVAYLAVASGDLLLTEKLRAACMAGSVLAAAEESWGCGGCACDNDAHGRTFRVSLFDTSCLNSHRRMRPHTAVRATLPAALSSSDSCPFAVYRPAKMRAPHRLFAPVTAHTTLRIGRGKMYEYHADESFNSSCTSMVNLSFSILASTKIFNLRNFSPRVHALVAHHWMAILGHLISSQLCSIFVFLRMQHELA